MIDPEDLAPHFVNLPAVRDWASESATLAEYVRSIGHKQVSAEYMEEALGLPLHLQTVIRRIVQEQPGATLDSLSSIPFFSLCKGLFLPLMAMHPDKVAQLFGFRCDPVPDSVGREKLVASFLARDLGLSLQQKLSCLLGDPFRGGTGSMKRDSLVRLYLSTHLASRRNVLDRLTQVGDISVLFAEGRPLHVEPALTAAEVLETLRVLPADRGAMRFDLLRSLLERAGSLEAYCISRLILKKMGLGFEYDSASIARVIASRFGATEEAVSHAMALTDPFSVATLLEAEGPIGLRKIQLQPLVPVRPALAGGTTDEVKQYPVWVERKYDGIRFMLHKATDATHSTLCAAYTRNRRDWLELVPNLEQAIRMIPAQNVILDGELYGTVVDLDGARPANVYEVYHALQGEGRPVQLKFAAFDLLYVNGHDLTRLPLSDRRQRLQALLATIGQYPLPIPINVADGQLAYDKNDLNRLYDHFRAQGYEGIISKTLQGTYALAERDPEWRKRKPEITLDLVLLGAVFAVTEKKTTGTFGSYVIGALGPDRVTFADVGDVAGVDQVKDREIQAEIMRDGLITGRRIERASASGVRPGIDLRPSIVVTVRFEGIVRDTTTGDLKMRDPKLVAIRSDKGPSECDSLKDIEELYLRQRD